MSQLEKDVNRFRKFVAERGGAVQHDILFGRASNERCLACNEPFPYKEWGDHTVMQAVAPEGAAKEYFILGAFHDECHEYIERRRRERAKAGDES